MSEEEPQPRTSGESLTVEQPLTAAQVARIERNRQAALLRRQARQESLPTHKLATSPKKARQAPKDSGGGFLIEESPSEQQLNNTQQISTNTEEPIECTECKRNFLTSFLRNSFDFPVCNSCRDKEIHDLITKTDSKKEYLLNDCDLEKREPPLKYILRKNPHERAKGDMKLYLRLQVEERALQVWGSEEELEAERERRSEKRDDRVQKTYTKKIKELRMSTRSSLFTRDFVPSHVHEFKEPVLIDEDKDLYEKTCSSCGHVVQYEEM